MRCPSALYVWREILGKKVCSCCCFLSSLPPSDGREMLLLLILHTGAQWCTRGKRKREDKKSDLTAKFASVAPYALHIDTLIVKSYCIVGTIDAMNLRKRKR